MRKILFFAFLFLPFHLFAQIEDFVIYSSISKFDTSKRNIYLHLQDSFFTHYAKIKVENNFDYDITIAAYDSILIIENSISFKNQEDVDANFDRIRLEFTKKVLQKNKNTSEGICLFVLSRQY